MFRGSPRGFRCGLLQPLRTPPEIPNLPGVLSSTCSPRGLFLELPVSSTQTLAPPLPGRAPAPGVTPANSVASRRERWIAAVVVLTPLVGLVAAVALLWQHGVTGVDLGLLAGMYTVTSFGIGIGYHRLVSHGAFQTPRWLRALFAVAGAMAAQGPVF